MNVETVRVPRVPPMGIPDIRFSSDRVYESISSNQAVLFNSLVYPLHIKIAGQPVYIKDGSTGKLINKYLSEGDELIVSDNSITKIMIQKSEVPVQYDLSQNYPNPFNPSTTIKFGLPEKANVTLTIYNQLGQKVAVLLNGEQDAGYHIVEWNAGNLVSGIYFYELKTEKFRSVKKLLLMK